MSLGVSQIQLERLAHIDDTSFYLSNITSTYGQWHRTCRIYFPVYYTYSELKTSVIMTIEPGYRTMNRYVDSNTTRSWRWISVTTRKYAQYSFGDFINYILKFCETHPAPGDIDDERCLVWDNLSIYNTSSVTHKIHGHHSYNNLFVVNCPSYYPTIAPINFVFCELASELSQGVKYNWMITILTANIIDMCTKLGKESKFENTFIHCNYPYI